MDEHQERSLIEVKQIGQGGSFGELALITQTSRNATIKCIEKTHVAIMTKADYLKILAKIIEKSKEE